MEAGWVCHVGTGAGVLVSPDRVVTAGHVLDGVGAAGGGQGCEVRLPGPGVTATGTVRRADGVDLAVIELDEPLGVAPAPVRPSRHVAGHRVLVPGNLTESDEVHRVARAVVVVADAGDGSAQLDVAAGDGYAIVYGHSGGPVIDEELGAVIGVCRAKEQHLSAKVGWSVPVEQVGEVFPELVPWLGWRLSEERPATGGQHRYWAIATRLSEARVGHWYPRALGRTGSGADVEGDSSLFSGRDTALTEIRAWVERGEPGVLFVTGEPGAGKSAVIAKLVVDADPLHGNGTARSFRYVFHAKDRSALELGRGLSDALGGPHDAETEAVLDLVRHYRPLVAVDGLDEAVSGQAGAIVDLAQSIGRAGGQVLVGARRSAIPPRCLPKPLNLDDQNYFCGDDLVSYCHSVLERRDQPGLANRWRGHLGALAAAKTIAARADRNFLVGALLALAHSETEPGEPVSGGTSDPEGALDALLDAIDKQLHWRPK